MQGFRRGKWFTRGWTLQELLAPDQVRFFDKDWQEIGTKESLHKTLSQATGIKHLFNFEDASVAQKMSWAAKRETTRLEDQAYCLLGIFGVNMPPLYGEGQAAFLRLQTEIMKISSDESLFAWQGNYINLGGMLAPSPKVFQHADDIKSVNPPWIERTPYSMTNQGLEIFLHLEKWGVKYCLAPLNCAREFKNDSSLLGVVLFQETTAKGRIYQRAHCQLLDSCEWPPAKIPEQQGDATAEPKLEKVWVNQPQMNSGTRPYLSFRIDTQDLCSAGWEIRDRVLLNSELGRWGADAEGCIHVKLSNSSASIVFQISGSLRLAMIMLKVSSTRKDAYAALFRVEEYGLKEAVLGHLERSTTADNHEIAGSEIKILRKEAGWAGRCLKASIWKEECSGIREIFAVKLEECYG